jgi:hypothetical protein
MAGESQLAIAGRMLFAGKLPRGRTIGVGVGVLVMNVRVGVLVAVAGGDVLVGVGGAGVLV